MESPRAIPEAQSLSPGSSGRRSSVSSSPEFEFWMVRNPSFPQPNLLSADELFVDGVLLPLRLLPHHSDPPDLGPRLNSPERAESEPTAPDPDPCPDPLRGPHLSSSAPESSSSSSVLTASKRWRDIFRKTDKKTAANISPEDKEKEKEKEKKKERKGGSGASSAELNINLWPFSRSRSAGNNGGRPRMAAGAPGTRKVSSAPCSRSNSAGESKSRKWPSSPGRAGVHLGRSSPVWQVRRGSAGVRSSEPFARNTVKGVKKDPIETRRNKTTVATAIADAGGSGAKARVLNLNVPMCMGYRHHLSCRSDENGAIGAGGGSGNSGGGGCTSGGGGGSSDGGRGVNLLNLRSLFAKKVY